MNATRSILPAVVLAAVTLAAVPASALDRERPLSRLHHTAWRASDGAPSQISALAQTEDGYLWIGSARGLFRFDGVRFERYAPPEGVALPSHNIYALLATPDGGLWVSFRPSGLGFLKDGHFEVYTRPEELPPSQVYCLASDRDGRIWAGTHTGLVRRAGSRWEPVGSESNLPPGRIRTLFVDRDGALWVATDETLHVLPRGSDSFRPTGVRVGVVPRVAQARDGRLWVAETSRARRVPVVGGGAGEPEIRLGAQEILFDRDGALWLVNTRGVCRVRRPERLGERPVGPESDEVESFTERDGLSGDLATNLLEDREGNIWVGTAKGLDRFRYGHLVPVSLPPGHQRLTLMPGSAGDLWIGSAAEVPLVHLRGDEASVVNVGREVSSVYRDPGGDVWWGTAGGLWRQSKDRFEFFPQPAGMPRDWIWEVTGSDNGGLWVRLGDVGLVHFKGGRWAERPTPAGLPDRGPSASYRDPSGRIWLGYTENRVCLVDGARVATYSQEDGVEIGRIRVIRGRGPHIWFGGELGLALFADGRFRTVAAAGGERFGTVSGIVETAEGELWLNELRGVVRIPAEEVGRAVADPAHAVTFERFDFLDGLPGAGQMNWTSSTAVEAADGRLWFATDNGLVWIDPRRLARNDVAPPVSILSVGSGDERHAAAKGVEFAAGTTSVEIAYAALSLSVPERVRFRYMLEGVDAEWREAGSRRQAFYTNLGPGDYRFRVIACNNDGVWNERGAVLAFSIAPAFYQTRWFFAACVAALACLCAAAYRWRLRLVSARLNAQFEERLAERTRIAQDLHDTLLQGFISASMQLDVAVDALPDDSPARPRLGRVLDVMRRVIDESRNAVRGLRSSGDGVSLELGPAFARVPLELAPQSDVAFRVVAEGRARPLHPVVRDEVYRIGREAVVNALRHASARRIDVELDYAPRRLRVLVRDDGRGIDPDVLRAGREGHWGLPGMRERADCIGARLKLSSRVGLGTEVELSVPGHIAYHAPSRARRTQAWLAALSRRRAQGASQHEDGADHA